MIKIILIISSIFLWFFFIFVSYANGVIKGLKIMSTRNIKTSELEKKLIKQWFKKDDDMDPFFYSLYMKDEMAKNTDAIKQNVETRNKENKTHEIISGSWMNKRSKIVWSVDEVVDEEDGTSSIIVYDNERGNNQSKTISKKTFLKNWTKV